jgi:serpin B
MRDRRVRVILPRFKITAEFQLKPPLQALGMKLAFSGGADFSGMIKAGGVFVDAVVHKAHVDVNERGTEAAAATAVPMTTSAPPTFRADHPFVFFIRENGTGSLLLAGRLANPVAG